jgi:hypothetical protein
MIDKTFNVAYSLSSSITVRDRYGEVTNDPDLQLNTLTSIFAMLAVLLALASRIIAAIFAARWAQIEKQCIADAEGNFAAVQAYQLHCDCDTTNVEVHRSYACNTACVKNVGQVQATPLELRERTHRLRDNDLCIAAFAMFFGCGVCLPITVFFVGQEYKAPLCSTSYYPTTDEVSSSLQGGYWSALVTFMASNLGFFFPAHSRTQRGVPLLLVAFGTLAADGGGC